MLKATLFRHSSCEPGAPHHSLSLAGFAFKINVRTRWPPAARQWKQQFFCNGNKKNDTPDGKIFYGGSACGNVAQLHNRRLPFETRLRRGVTQQRKNTESRPLRSRRYARFTTANKNESHRDRVRRWSNNAPSPAIRVLKIANFISYDSWKLIVSWFQNYDFVHFF